MCYSLISTHANLPISSSHFWKHKSVFIQILHQSSVSLNITPLYFFYLRHYILWSKEPIKEHFFLDFQVLESKFVKFIMSILKRQVNSSSIFKSFFVVKTHNSSVNFKLIHLLLLTKGSHESPNFYTFKCSGENLPNSSCCFPNHI